MVAANTNDMIANIDSVGSRTGWREEAQRTLDLVATLKKRFTASANELTKAKKAEPKGKAIAQKRALRKVGQELRAAKNKFEEQIAQQAKRECRPLCEKVHTKLPQELRDLICASIITDHNATFFHGENGKPSVANGTSPLQHCFEPAYTGTGLHRDMVVQLGIIGSRFDFRGHHELLEKVFEHYRSVFHLDLATTIKKVGVVLTEYDLTTRESLENLFKLGVGTVIYIFVETGCGTQNQTLRRCRRVLHAFFPLLIRLKNAGYLIKVVANPDYRKSKVNNSSGSSFSIVPEAPQRYEITPDNAQFTAKDFVDKLKQCFEEYGDTWYLRTNPLETADEDQP